MKYYSMDIFRIVFFILIFLFRFTSANSREINVALNAMVYEMGNNDTSLDAIVDGDPTTCVQVADGRGLHLRLKDVHVINKIKLETGKGYPISNVDEIKLGIAPDADPCSFGVDRKVAEVRCFEGQVHGDYLQVEHKFKRTREWCEIQLMACQDGYFGMECTLDCHCDGSEVCHKISGACLGGLCSSGWEGDDCQQVCTNGTYGKNCVGVCHCEEGLECDVMTGTCPQSRCSGGWYGSTCQTGMALIRSVSLYTESETSIDILWHSWGDVMDGELNLTFVVLYIRSGGGGGGADDDVVAIGGKRKGGNKEGDDESEQNIVDKYLNKGWKRGPDVDHASGRLNYIKTVDNLNHNTFYEFVVIPKLTLAGGADVYGQPSVKTQPYRTKCKAPGQPSMKNVTSYVDNTHTIPRAAINVPWMKLSDSESNCENILYYEIYYEDTSRPMAERVWLKKTVHPINEEVNITGVQFGTDYRVKMCVLNNYHLESCCDPIRLKTHEPPMPTFNHHSAISASHNAAIIVGVLFLVLVAVIVVSIIFLQRQRYSRSNKKFTESFFNRNESQVGLATDLSHSSEHDDLLSQIVIHRSSLLNNNSNHNNKHYEGAELQHNNNNNMVKVRQLERAFNLPVQKSVDEMLAMSRSVSREELVPYVDEMRTNNYRSIKREYEEIPSENPEATKKVGQMPCNIMKNRFKDVIAYDHTRVVLKNEGEGEDPNMNYINANYIDGHNKPKAYIATQGCKKNTVTDFWNMIWQQDARRIVMVTNLIERSSIKCQQYWPENVGSSSRHGNIEVTLNDVIKTTHYTIRSLKVTRKGIERDVKQFHFTAWPDQGVPSKVNQMLTFRNKVRSCDDDYPGIIVVHCSAGIGRTGAFIALDICVDQLDDEGKADVMKTTTMMRLQRCNLIQRVEQYIFVYTALAEYLKVGNTSVQSSKFNSYHQNLVKVKRSKGSKEARESEAKNSMEEQFELLQALTAESSSSSSSSSRQKNNDEAYSALLSHNKDKNRYSSIVPNDKSRPYLTSVIEGTNDYINAVYLDGYKSKNAYIITQMPLPSTVIDFWRLVFEHDVRIIIMLNSFRPSNLTYGQYWPDEHQLCDCGPFIIQSLDVYDEGNVSVRELELSCKGEVPMNSSLKSRYDSSPHQVIIFQMSSLDRDYFLNGSTRSKVNSSQVNELVRSTAEDLSQLIELVDEKVSQIDVDLPVVVHCDDGHTLSGLFVAISCIHERLKVEGEVDVFQTVRNLKSSQNDVIPSLKQYQFCYDMASKFVNEL